MKIFESIKESITVPQAAERYGVERGRGGMALCPFHNDRHPSLFIADDHYHCFACGEHGDVIDFTARLFNCGLYKAAQKLAADFGIKTGDTPNRTIPLRPTEAQLFREKERLCLSVCEDYVRLLSDWKAEYASQEIDAEPDARYVEACRYLEQYEYYIEVLISGYGDERTELVGTLTAGGKLDRLRDRINKARYEEEANGIFV